jgi:hypothetical protein
MINTRVLGGVLSCALSAVAAVAPSPATVPQPSPTHVELLILNKITTKVDKLIAPLGHLTRYKDLHIRPQSCTTQTLGLNRAVTTAFMEVWQEPRDHTGKGAGDTQAPRLLYSQFMSSELPALEHDTYTIRLKSCRVLRQSAPIG